VFVIVYFEPMGTATQALLGGVDNAAIPGVPFVQDKLAVHIDTHSIIGANLEAI